MMLPDDPDVVAWIASSAYLADLDERLGVTAHIAASSDPPISTPQGQ